MKKRMKKGFTIVELVIVIAVIAILAAVLIPTFSNLIHQANVTSDQAAVRNMNLALAAAEADGEPTTLTDVLNILSEAGMDAKDYKALAKDHKFVWDNTINRVLYVTGDNQVEYPEEYKNIEYQFGTNMWVTLTGQMPGDETWFTTGETVTNYALNGETYSGTKYTVASASQLVSFADYMRSEKVKDNGKGVIIELAENAEIDLKGAEWISIGEYKGIFNGNGVTIRNLVMTDRTQDCPSEFTSTTKNTYRPYGFITVFSGEYFGNVTFENVKVVAPGEVSSSNHTVAAAVGAIVNYDTTRTTIVDNIKVTGEVTGAYRVAGIVGFVGGSSVKPMTGNVTISNCVNEATVTSTLCAATYNTAAGILSANNQMEEGSTLIIENNVNKGSINGQVAGGIVGATFGAGSRLKNGNVYTEEYSAGSKGRIIIRGNTNEGTVTANHIDGYMKESWTANGEYIYTVETSSRAAGIISGQTHQERCYVYGNVNTGTIIVKNESASGEKKIDQIAFACTVADGASMGCLLQPEEDTTWSGSTENSSNGTTQTL